MAATRRWCCVISCLFFVTLALGGCGDADPGEDRQVSAGRASETGTPLTVHAKVDSAQVSARDKVRYRIEVRYREGVEVEFPVVLKQFANGQIDEVGTWRDEPDFGSLQVKAIELVLNPGVGPVLTIPPTTIRWKEAGSDTWESSTTEAISVEVESVDAASLEFRESDEGFDLPAPDISQAEERSSWIWWAGGGALLLLAAGLFVWQKKRRAGPKALKLPGAHEVALAELDRLESAGLLAAGKVQEHYYRLTAILCHYIGDRFGLRAPEQTTEEFLDSMQRGDELPAEHKETLGSFLAEADLVKYARQDPGSTAAGRSMDLAREFVQSTIDPAVSTRKRPEGVAHAL